MSASRLRTALIVASASIGLTGCVGAYGPMGGVSVGYGNGGYYDPYYGGYGYGGYGRSPYGYGYPGSYYGWYDNYYYPGTGYYVYDRYGNRYRWNDRYRRYWESRRGDGPGDPRKAVTPGEFVENWSGYQQGTTGTRSVNRVRSTAPTTTVQQRSVRTQAERLQARDQRREELRQQLRDRSRTRRSRTDDSDN